jgi:rare lipoprotein A
MDRGQGIQAGRLAVVLMAGAALAACGTITPKYAVRGGETAAPYARAPGGPRLKGTDQPYQVGGIWYVPHDQPRYDEKGIASWYGDAFNMKATADGEIFNMDQFSAAHTTLPLPSMVEVTNLDNGHKLVVRVNDRGPFVGGRIIDLSRAAAQELGYDRAGTAHVRVRYVGPAPLAGPGAGVRYAKASPPPAAYAQPRVTQVAANTLRRPADEEIFAESASSAAAVVTPLVKAPEAVTVSVLAPLAPVRNSRSVPISDAPAPAASASPIYHIQAGAFSDQDNARRAAAQLAATGTATIEPMERGGTTLYRVILPGPADEAEAFAMRDKVAGIGFADARVLRP